MKNERKWEEDIIGNIFQYLPTQVHSRNNLTHKENEAFLVYNIHYGDIHAMGSKPYLDVSKEDLPRIAQKIDVDQIKGLLQRGDLVIADASEDYDGIAACLEIGNLDGKYVTGGLHTFVLRDLKNTFIDGYRTYIFKNHEVRKSLKRIATGISVLGLTKSNFKKIVLPIPPPSEQKKIADILSTWDRAIETTEALIEQLRLRKKGLMQQLLSGKKRLPGFTEEWRKYSIDTLFTKVNRFVVWNEEKEYELVSIRRRYGGMFHRENKLGKHIGVKKLKTISKGDFLISKRQVSHGAWVVVSDQFIGGNVSNEYDCLEISSKEVLNQKFWASFCQQKHLTHFAFLDSIGVHIEKLIFHYSLFKKRRVKIPPTIQEQLSIAQFLSTLDNQLSNKIRYLDELKAQKKGLMQQLLTGQKRVAL